MPQERKVVTVLFADMVDSSGTARSYDAEVLRTALADTFARIREILTGHGATVEKFIGDAVMAVFGVPSAHEDDAERAVRAAIALRDGVSAERVTGRPSFVLRIGINTGEVVTGDVSGGEFLVTGSPVIVAARLEQHAQAGEILVGPLTREITRGRIRYGRPRIVDAKGIGAIEAAPAETIVGAADRPAEVRSPFVGRDAELRLLDDLHRRVTSTGRPHLITVYGEPGLGKSRLAVEFLRRLGDEPAARVACLPYGHAITYWPLQELIRGEAAIAPTDSREIAREKIRTRVSEMTGLEDAEAHTIARDLTALALAYQDAEPTDLTSEQRRRELAVGVTRYLEARLGSTTGTIVLEDLHWAEEPLLALLEELIDHLRAPLLLICLARPDLLGRRTSWGAGRTNAISLTLEPLERHEAEQLARGVLGDRADQRVLEIVERTEGNPLFVEEYARMLLDQGSGVAVPPTLQGVIAARLDGLAPSIKRLLQEASVVGRDFWLDALPGQRSSAESDAGLAERTGLIRRRTRRGPSGTHTYSFRHGLIRDVAYGSLSKAERAQTHDHFARWLESSAGERAREYAEIAAFHAERAFELARELGMRDGESLGRRAFTLLAQTAEAAAARGEFRGARDLSERALKVAATAPVEAAERVKAEALAAMVRFRLDSDSAAIAELDRAIASARAAGASASLVHLLIWRASSVTLFESVSEAERLFAEALAVARRSQDPEQIAYAVWASSEPAGIAGRLDAQARLLSQALAEIRSAATEQWEVSCLAEIGVNAIERGDLDGARARAAEAAALAARSGRRLDRFKAADLEARVLNATSDPRSISTAETLAELAAEVGGPWATARAAEVVGLAREHAADADGALRALDDTLAQLDAEKMPSQREAIARLQAIRARVLLAHGDRDAARRAAMIASHVAPPTHVAAKASAALELAAVETADGSYAEARALLDEARSLLAPTEFRALRDRADQVERELAMFRLSP